VRLICGAEQTMSDFQVYISYARDDDVSPPGTPGARGFVSCLQEQLSFELKEAGASDIKMWRDMNEIAFAHELVPVVRDAISRSSMLLVILSRSWLHSPYAQQELRMFAERCGQQEVARQRIVPVCSHHIEQNERPSLLQGLDSFNFYSFDGSGAEREFFAAGEVRDKRYHAEVRALARHLMGSAREMRGAAGHQERELSHLIRELLSKCGAPEATARPLPARASHQKLELPVVLINAHEIDTQYAITFKNLLGQIPSVLPLPLQGDVASFERHRDHFRKSVVACDALVTIWGEASEAWVNMQLRETAKVMRDRKQPLRLSVLAQITPPASDRMRRMGSGLPRLIKGSVDEAAQFVLRELERLFELNDALPRSLGAAATPTQLASESAPVTIDIVSVSAFAPESARAGDQILVQVFLHCPNDAATARALAQQADPETRPRGAVSLETEIARGQKVGVALEASGLTVDQDIQYLTWRGDPRACGFLVSLPPEAAGRQHHVRVRVTLESVLVGELRFTLRVAARGEAVVPALTMRGEWAKRYRHAFLSYASPDRAEVVKRAMMLKAVGIDFFLDLLSLDPGERWERRLYEEIDRCDIFFLFWSSNAASSDWVVREAEYALKRREASDENEPSVTPVIIEGPPVPQAPESLKRIHFNDPLCYVLAGIEASERAGART
jgi:TIR domain